MTFICGGSPSPVLQSTGEGLGCSPRRAAVNTGTQMQASVTNAYMEVVAGADVFSNVSREPCSLANSRHVLQYTT